MKFENLVLPSNQKFGFFLQQFFNNFNLFWISSNSLPLSNICCYFYDFFVTAIEPQISQISNILWMYIGYLIGSIVSPLVLGAIFILYLPLLAFF